MKKNFYGRELQKLNSNGLKRYYCNVSPKDGVVGETKFFLSYWWQAYVFTYHLPLRGLTPSDSPVIGGEQPSGRRRIGIVQAYVELSKKSGDIVFNNVSPL